jgi:type I restriction enzyme S subunit
METVLEQTKVEKYSEYKDSGVEWLGEIPKPWETKRIKFLFQIGRGRVIAQTELVDEGIYPVYSSQTHNNGVLGYIKTYDFDCTQITWTTDGANAGTIFLRTGKHNCTNVCGTLKPITSKLSIEFIRYALEIAAQYYKRPDTNGAKIMNGEMAAIFVTFPPLPEQTAIASFLDRKTALIDQAINIKQKQIELLKERRQILIHKAVTRGLNPNVKMKDSGVEWIREIPDNWEVKRVKNLGKILNGFAFNSNEFKDEGVRVMKIANIQTMRIDWSDESFVDEKYFRLYPQFQITRDDLVFALTRPIISTGIKATIVESDEKILLNQRNAVLKPSKDLDKKWIYFIILDTQFVQAFDNQIDKTGQQPNISTYNIGNLQIPFPEIEEQIQISKYLEILTSKIATAISLKEQEIEKLKEYKGTLINSAVTGKIKVSAIV